MPPSSRMATRARRTACRGSAASRRPGWSCDPEARPLARWPRRALRDRIAARRETSRMRARLLARWRACAKVAVARRLPRPQHGARHGHAAERFADGLARVGEHRALGGLRAAQRQVRVVRRAARARDQLDTHIVVEDARDVLHAAVGLVRLANRNLHVRQVAHLRRRGDDVQNRFAVPNANLVKNQRDNS